MGKNPIHAFGTTESSVGKVKEGSYMSILQEKYRKET
jgi:hypothetical protein